MGISNPIQPNPVFESLPPPWQLQLLDAWTASVNLAVNSLYADPVSFNASIFPPPTPVQIIPGNSTNVVIRFPNVNFQVGNSYNPANGTFTAPNNGIFHFDFGVSLANNIGGAASVEVAMSRNSTPIGSGADNYQFMSQNFPNTATAFYATGSVTIQMNAGDIFQMLIATAGAQISVSSGFGNQFCWFSGFAVQ